MDKLLLDLKGTFTQFSFEWEALLSKGQKCYIWKCKQIKTGTDIPVVYRHVVDVPKIGIVTVYVGQGKSLNGPTVRNLVFQYSGHGSTRVRVKQYLQARSEVGWTEILKLSQPLLDLREDSIRKFVEHTFITAYFWEHRRLSAIASSIPDFLNRP